MTILSKLTLVVVVPTLLLLGDGVTGNSVTDTNVNTNSVETSLDGGSNGRSSSDDISPIISCSVFCQWVGHHNWEPCNNKCHELPYAECITECDLENKKRKQGLSSTAFDDEDPAEYDECDTKCNHKLSSRHAGPFIPHWIQSLSVQQTCMNLCEYNGNRPYQSCALKCDTYEYATCVADCGENMTDKDTGEKVTFDVCDTQCFVAPPKNDDKDEDKGSQWPDPNKPKKTFPTDPDGRGGNDDNAEDNDEEEEEYVDPVFDASVCKRICLYQGGPGIDEQCTVECQDIKYATCMRKCGNSPGNFYECPTKCASEKSKNMSTKIA